MISALDLATNTLGNQVPDIAKAIDPEQEKSATTVVMTEVFPIFTLYFDGFKRDYGKSSADEIRPVAREYARQLIKNGIGQKRLPQGLERAKQLAADRFYAPNPQAFADLCKIQPEDINLPSIEEAIHQVIDARGRCKGQSYTFKHAIVENLNRQVGFQMYELSRAEWLKLVKSSYELLTKQALRGEMEIPKHAIEFKVVTKNTPLQDTIQELGEMIQKERANDPLISRIAALRQEAKA